MREHVAKNLLQARERANISQEELAMRAGTPASCGTGSLKCCLGIPTESSNAPIRTADLLGAIQRVGPLQAPVFRIVERH
ncbi:MAG TPA: hypothetical protein VJQ84_03370, partial [Solirubrobacterales bacterium]|nr:hypothetical protein [Solirubrobacterales bacterium]